MSNNILASDHIPSNHAPVTQRFLHFVAAKRLVPEGFRGRVIIRASIPQRIFPGRLIVRHIHTRRGEDGPNVFLHILYDPGRISRLPDPERAYESIFLHEIGHARLQLQFFIDRQSVDDNQFVDALPAHEIGAWHYESAVRARVHAIRSVVGRLLVDLDPEF